jgi:hypothetical protein
MMSDATAGAQVHASSRELDRLIDQLSEEDADFAVLRDALCALGSRSYCQLAEAARHALARHPQNHAVLLELPWILRECAPNSLSLVQALGPFLHQGDAATLSVVFDVLVELGEPRLTSVIAPFQADEREVIAHGKRAGRTVGEAARSAMERLFFGE